MESRIEEEVRKMKGEIESLQKELQRTKKENQEAASRMEEEVRKMKEDIERLQNELQHTKRENQELTAQMEVEVRKMKGEIERLQNELQQKKKENQEVVRERDRILREKERLQNEREKERAMKTSTQLKQKRHPTVQQMQTHSSVVYMYTWNGGFVKPGRTMDNDVKQTSYLARAIPLYLLSERGIRINEFTQTPKGVFPEPPECLRTEDFLTTRSNLVTGCHYIMRKHGKELEEMCAKLDISDEQLYASFQTVMSTICKELMNCGRLVSMFVFTSVLSARLCHEGRQHCTESIFGWFEAFLKEQVLPWIRELGGWGRLFNDVNMNRLKVDGETTVTVDATTSGLLALAAIGVGFLAAAITRHFI